MRRNSNPPLPQPRHQVLLLHDDRQFVEAVKRLLDQDGRLEVLWVDNAYDAGRVTRDQVPELILLSDHLPDVQVVEVLRRVRDDRTLEGLRVLCLSASGEHEARDLVSSGADEVLPRPCDPALILDAVHRQLGLNPRQEGSSGWPHLN